MCASNFLDKNWPYFRQKRLIPYFFVGQREYCMYFKLAARIGTIKYPLSHKKLRQTTAPQIVWGKRETGWFNTSVRVTFRDRLRIDTYFYPIFIPDPRLQKLNKIRRNSICQILPILLLRSNTMKHNTTTTSSIPCGSCPRSPSHPPWGH